MGHLTQSENRKGAHIRTAFVAVALIVLSGCEMGATDPEEVSSDIMRTVGYSGQHATSLTGGPGVRCDKDIWRGTSSQDWTTSRPILGSYASGRKSPAVDSRRLTSDDMAIGIDNDLRRLWRPGLAEDGLSKGVTTYTSTDMRNSPYYIGAASVAHNGMVKAEIILTAIIRRLGPPRYADNPGCMGSIVLLYGNPVSPDTPDGQVPRKTKPIIDTGVTRFRRIPAQCIHNRDFIQINVFNGSYSVRSKEICSNGVI